MSDDPTEPQNYRRADYAQKKGEVVLRKHEYDGIQEFDQKLPNWWLFTLYIAIVWTIVHWSAYYYTNRFETDQEKVMKELAVLQEKKDAALAETLATLDDATLVSKWAQDPAALTAGEVTFATYCVACHAADMSATMQVGDQSVPLPGLSLVDGEWKYGSQPMDIFKIINDGSPAGSTGHNGALMQPWGQTLSTQQITEVTAYVISKNMAEFAP